jgi:hypothetical protein
MLIIGGPMLLLCILGIPIALVFGRKRRVEETAS